MCISSIRTQIALQEIRKWLPFSKSEDNELAQPDRDLVAKMMKLDPRQDQRQESFCKMRGSSREAEKRGPWGRVASRRRRRARDSAYAVQQVPNRDGLPILGLPAAENSWRTSRFLCHHHQHNGKAKESSSSDLHNPLIPRSSIRARGRVAH